MRGGSVGRAEEAAQQRSGNSGQFCGSVGSVRAAKATQRRRWMRRRQLGGGGQRGGRAAAAARHWRWRWHGGRGGDGGSPITPATALLIPLLIAAARLGDVAVSLCGMRGCGGLRGGSVTPICHIGGLRGESVTPICHIPVNRVDKVVRFAGILTKKN